MKPRFLVADHDRGIAEAVTRCLVSRGYEAESASDALQCTEKIRNSSPSVLVLDPCLLWGGGDGVMNWLKSEDPVSRPTVFTVCDDESYSISEEMFWGTDFLIRRPHCIGELLPYVNQLEILGSLDVQSVHQSRANFTKAYEVPLAAANLE